MVKKHVILILMLTVFLGNTVIGNSEDIQKDKIVINIPSRTLTYQGSTSSKIYPVAVGKPNTKTPVGNYSILNKTVNPYYSRKKIPGGRSDNPLGIRWMGFKTNYGIHGNSAPDSIGTTASGGCVRMFNYDVKELYEKVKYNTKVEVTYNLFQLFQKESTIEKGLIVYPDVYKKEKSLKEAIRRELETQNILNENTQRKIDETEKTVKNRIAVIADQWVLIVNQHHISMEIIKDEKEFYISENVLRDYFGLWVEERPDNQFYIQELPVNCMVKNEKYYVALGSLHNILGGTIHINDTLENLWYNVSFVKLNGVFLEINNSKLETHKPLIPIDKLSAILPAVDITAEKKVMIADSKYVDIEAAQNLFGFQYDIQSLDKKIELFKIPEIVIATDSSLSSQMFDNIYSQVKKMDIFKSVGTNATISLGGMENQFDIQWDSYKTKIILKVKKTIPAEKADEIEETTI